MAKKIPKIVKSIQKYKIGEFDYSNQKLISFSQISMYEQCPRKWALQYVEGHKVFSSSIHTIFGSSLHVAIQHYLNVFYNKSKVAADSEDIASLFEETFREEYKKEYKKNNNQHFSSPEELREFFEDGINIINFIKKKKSEYFGKRSWYLVGCEVPIMISPNERYNNVVFKGFLDIVLYNENTDTIKIIDLKTSKGSWTKEQKSDKNKQSQLLLYKKFFSEQFKFPINKVEVEFMILKRKLFDNSEYAQSRIQIHVPPSGKTSINFSIKKLNEFIENVFNENGYKPTNNHLPVENKYCKYCPFYKVHLCPATFEK